MSGARMCSAAVLLLCCGWPVSAWGPVGHRTVGLIAERHMTPNALAKLRLLMGKESLPEAATWADDIRSDPGWKAAGPWHYINVEDNEAYGSAPKHPGGDVYVAMTKFEAALRDPASPLQAKKEALRFLVHFVGDVHQPLHVGRRTDRGANAVRVGWFNTGTNLHSVWDDEMIDSSKLSFTELADFIDKAKDSEVKVWQNSTYMDWINESFELRKQAYDVGDGKLGYDYSYKNFPLLKQRLLQAGIRLAGLFNSIFYD